MRINQKSVQGLFDVSFEPAHDHRGYLAKPFDEKPFADAGIEVHWKQIIVQHTEKKNTVKGFHIQIQPFTEAKLIVPVYGEFIWVSVDVRSASPTYGKAFETRFFPGNNAALFASRGFAHGFFSFENDTKILIDRTNGFFTREDEPDSPPRVEY